MFSRLTSFRLVAISTRRTLTTKTPNVCTEYLSMPELETDMKERIFVDMNPDHFAEIHGGRSSILNKVETILSEYEHMKYNTMGRVPSVLTRNDMELVLKEGLTPLSREKLFNYLFKREMAKRATKLRIERDKTSRNLKRALKLEEYKELGRTLRSGLLGENDEIVYGLWHNNLFCRLAKNKIKSGLSMSRLRSAAQFGRKLIFDFGYEKYMENPARHNTCDQIQGAYGLNRYYYKDPFDFWFCNFDENSPSAKFMREKALLNLYNHSMITIKSECPTQLFDKSKLVYLSPHAKEPLKKVSDSDDIYIIGAYNDKGHAEPVSLRKANQLGLRVRCLPIDKHVLWGCATKSLCINHVTGILLEAIENGDDWYKAFMKHIPPRKMKSESQIREEEELRKVKFRKNRKNFLLADKH